MIDIIIDPEFRDLIQPLSSEEYETLKELVLKDGITDSLKVWRGKNILLDGHNRYELAKKYNLDFEVTYLDFDTREEALLWEIKNQLGRRNLDAVYRMDLAEKQRDIYARQAREKKVKAGKTTHSNQYTQSAASVKNDRSCTSPSTPQATKKPASSPYRADVPIEVIHVPTSVERIDDVHTKRKPLEDEAKTRQQEKSQKQKQSQPTTRDKLAEAAGVSTGQYAQYEQLKKKRPDLLQKARERELTIGGAYAAMKKDEKKQAKAEEVKKAQSLIASEQGEGSAKLIVGDSIGKTIDCDLLLTDPPYSTDVDDIDEFVDSWLFAALDGVKPTGFAYVFIGAYPEELRAYLNAEIPAYLELCQVLVWEYKNTLGQNPKGRYKQNWQACLFYRGVDAPDLNCPLTNEQWAVQEVNAPDGRLGDRYHAWQKPLDLVTRFIRHSTTKGATVYDPFACTGTTLIAAAKLGRNGIGYEIDEKNAEIAFGRGVARGT